MILRVALRVLGIDDESELVYTALVRNPHHSSAQLAAICELPTAVVGQLLSKLVKDGLATRTTGRPPYFTAAAPDTAVTQLISERERELGEARALVHRLADMHREAARVNNPAIAVELLSTRDDVSAAARRLSAVAQHQVRGFDRPPYVDRPGSNLGGQLQRQQEGVAYRIIYDRTAVAWPGRLQNDIIPSMRAGEQSRVHPELPLKVVIADSHVAIIPFSQASDSQAAAYLVYQSPLLEALEALFEAYWVRATPVPDFPDPGGQAPNAHQPAAADELDEDTRHLLTLLASGLTDAAIARAQGWSERTTQRRVQQLMNRLGAVTRFQASLIAVKRGWL